jgi:hypothetical protein
MQTTYTLLDDRFAEEHTDPIVWNHAYQTGNRDLIGDISRTKRAKARITSKAQD